MRRLGIIMLAAAFVLVGINYTRSVADTQGYNPSADGEKWAVELFGETLVNAEGEEIKTETLAEMDKVAIYFSAQWCPPCRAFTPMLVKAYNEAKEDGAKVELVFVSSDQDKAAMHKYMKDYKMDWVAVPFEGPRREIGTKFSVRGIPTLVILDGDGKVLTDDGRNEVASKGAAAFK